MKPARHGWYDVCTLQGAWPQEKRVNIGCIGRSPRMTVVMIYRFFPVSRHRKFVDRFLFPSLTGSAIWCFCISTGGCYPVQSLSIVAGKVSREVAWTPHPGVVPFAWFRAKGKDCGRTLRFYGSKGSDRSDRRNNGTGVAGRSNALVASVGRRRQKVEIDSAPDGVQ